MSSFHPRIAIIGAGPAGLTASVLLHKHGIPFGIFELRNQPTPEELARPVGVLDLHEESGLAALKKCDLFDAFLPLTGDCAEVLKISDKDGNVLVTHGADIELHRPEISRNALNDLLMSRLPAGAIKWGHKLLSATSLASGDHTAIELDFGVQGKQMFDLVIGADGAWSKVRKILTAVAPEYAGRQHITVSIRGITQKYPHLAELIGPGSFFALGGRKGVAVQRGSLDSARMYISITTPDESFGRTSGLSSETAAGAKDKLLLDDELFGTWGTRVKELIAIACDEESKDNPCELVDMRPIYGLPVDYSWEHNPGATLIGDAAHLMPPNGEGVNIAMLDAMLLSEAITKAHETNPKDLSSFQSALSPLMRDFEAEMVVRAKQAAEDGKVLNEMLFHEDGAEAIATFFRSHDHCP